MKILVVDDEPMILETVEHKLRREGFSTFTADSAEEGMRIFKRVKPDLLILDVMLPRRSGFELCKTIRKDHSTPIIFVTARGEEQDRIDAFEMGADDYVVKPFNLSELAARVRAVLRRSSSSGFSEKVEIGNLKIDPESHTALMDGVDLDLSPREFALLYFLARNSGKVFGRDTLLDRVWGRDSFVSSRTVDVHVRWLRSRIEEDPNNPERIITVRGVGYKMVG
ncbi:MAG: response regulator transcription factor [Fimbriimonadaceae bacterium]